jgi:hypothetical protein
MDRSSTIFLPKLIHKKERLSSTDADEDRCTAILNFSSDFLSPLTFTDAELPKRVGEIFRLSIP